MKQVSTLFDALRNEKFAVAVKDDYGVKYYGTDGQGREWAEWANSINTKSIESGELPAGIIQGPYKNMSDSSIKSLLSSLGAGSIEITQSLADSKSYSYKSSYKVDNGARVPAVMDTPISHFTKNQYVSAVNYKGLTLRTQIKEGSFLLEARANNYAFNFEKWMYSSQPSKAETKSLRSRLDENLGRSSERRLGMKLKTALTNSGSRIKIGQAINIETKSIDESLEAKSIGQRIGGAGRIGRRAARSFAMFDPKAWDGDGDGVVQEGTPFERPAIPGVNDRSTGGMVDAARAAEAWRDFKKTGTKPGGLSSRTGSDNRRTERLGDRTPETVYPRGAERGIGNEGLRSRVSTARTDRQVSGLASRSGKSKAKSKLKATPGRDRVDELDGSLWASLTPEQQAVVEENTKAAYGKLQEAIKKDRFLGEWWESFLKLDRPKTSTDADGNEWSEDSRIAGEAFTSFEVALSGAISDMEYEIASKKTALSQMSGQDAEKQQRAIKRAEKSLERTKKILDDLRTYDQMAKTGDWSLLEHLHPEQRKRSFGDGPKSEQGSYKSPFEGKAPRGIYDKIKAPSTIFEEIGGVKRKQPKLIGEKGDKKLADLAERVLRPNPERARRRELRKIRKAGGKAGRSGFTIDEEDVPTKKKIKRRIAKAKRAIKRKFGKDRSPENIDKQIQAGSTLRIFDRDDDGKIYVSAETIDMMDEVINAALKANGRGEFKGQDGANMLLAYLWENNGFNGTPTTVNEEEVIALLDKGWYPIKRGTGKEDFAEEWLRNDKRRISGQGGQAEGPGEYFAHADSAAWDSVLYWGQAGTSSGVLALIPPSYKVANAEDRNNMSVQFRRIADVMSDVIKIQPKGEADKMDPADFVGEFKESILRMFPDSDPIWDSEVGQMWSSLVNAYAASSGPEKAKLWNVLQFFSTQLMRQEGWINYIPLILGYDAIDVTNPPSSSARVGGNNNGRQMLIFNRQGLAALETTVNIPQINEILARADRK